MSKKQTKNRAIYTRQGFLKELQAEKEFSSCENKEEKIKSFIESQIISILFYLISLNNSRKVEQLVLAPN